MAEYGFRRFAWEKLSQGEDNCLLAVPELSDGFDLSLPQGKPGLGLTPVSYCTENVPFGIYQVSLSFTAMEDIPKLYLFTGRRQLREVCSMKKGECFSAVYYQSAAEIIPRYHAKAYPARHLFFTLCTEKPGDIRLGECRAYPADGEAFRIFLCGDSTVTDHPSEIPYHPGACYGAWGQALPAFLTGAAAVENQAHCGLTTEDFRGEGHWKLVLRHLKGGDICLFQFGHNDQKLPHLWPNGEYPGNLSRFVRETREKGAFPVLVTPLGRNTWTKDQTYLDLLGEHAQAVRDVGEALDVPVIDLHGYSIQWIKAQGMEACRSYFHPGDYTHTNDYGAVLFARWIAGELAKVFPEKLRADGRGASFAPASGSSPGSGSFLGEKEGFVPPPDLWEMLGQGQPAGKRKGTPLQDKEQFDQMEKSTAGLLEMIAQAKKGSLGKDCV